MRIGSLFSGCGALRYYERILPRGAKPKTYDPALVERISHLYCVECMTQVEIAACLGIGAKVVQNVIKRHGIPSRPAGPRNQRGPQSPSWKGTRAGYQAKHLRVQAARGTPAECERCGSTDPMRTYEWANLTGNYDDVTDYMRMCRSCHRLYDNKRREGGGLNCQKSSG